MPTGFSIVPKLAELQPVDWLRYFGLMTWLAAAISLASLPLLVSEAPAVSSIVGWWSAAIL
ncbi:MAG: hypothetical protein V2J10_01240, partial [Wenzhouxiangella sp.]|nr:hypothetical protein [Wenzhouxiangella sp.]